MLHNRRGREKDVGGQKFIRFGNVSANTEDKAEDNTKSGQTAQFIKEIIVEIHKLKKFLKSCQKKRFF